MEIPYHPLKNEIGDFLHKYLDKEIIIKANLGSFEITIDGNDAVGTILEEFIAKLLTEKFEHLIKGESNEPPDIFDGKNKWNLEVKCFKMPNVFPPAFDIYSVSKFLGEKGEDDWLSKALYKTDYLIFGYEINSEGKRYLKSIHHKKLHEILGYGGKHEISVQYSGGQYKHIRPSSTPTWNNETKTPKKFIKHFKKFIDKLPVNLTGNKSELKKHITKQFDNLNQEIDKNKSS